MCNVQHTHCYVSILDPITYHYFYLTCQLYTVHHQYSLHLFMPQHRYILTRPRHNYDDDSTILTLHLHHNRPHLIRARTSQYDTTYTIFFTIQQHHLQMRVSNANDATPPLSPILAPLWCYIHTPSHNINVSFLFSPSTSCSPHYTPTLSYGTTFRHIQLALILSISSSPYLVFNGRTDSGLSLRPIHFRR